MNYEKLKVLSNERFKRYLGVSKELFEEMVNVRSRTRLGNTPKLSYEEQLCMTLTYFREYELSIIWG